MKLFLKDKRHVEMWHQFKARGLNNKPAAVAAIMLLRSTSKPKKHDIHAHAEAYRHASQYTLKRLHDSQFVGK